MKLFPSLSILHLAAAGSDFHVEGCLSVAVPWGGLDADLDSNCVALGDALKAFYPDMGFRMDSCFESCTVESDLDAMTPVDIAYASGQLNPATANLACLDVCVEVWNIDEDAVGADDEQLVLKYIEDSISLPYNGVAKFINVNNYNEFEGSGSGDEPTTTTGPATTGTTTSGTGTTTTGITTTTTVNPFEGYSEYRTCVTMYLPILWILGSIFGNVDELCFSFTGQICDSFHQVGAKCWETMCSGECSGNGLQDDVSDFLDNDAEAAEDSQTSEKPFDTNGRVKPDAPRNKPGCFDYCWTVHATDQQISNVIALWASTRRGFSDKMSNERFLANRQKTFENIADFALLDSIVEDGEYTGGMNQLIDDTVDAGFTCDANCDDSNIVDTASSTMWGKTDNAALSGIDCQNGNNGGCSHLCTGEGVDGVCSCPNDCWDLVGKECQIPADKVLLKCEPDRMVAYVAKCIVEDEDEGVTSGDYHLSDSDCNPSTGFVNATESCPTEIDSNGTGCMSFNTRLDECSTGVTADYTSNIMTFSQVLQSAAVGQPVTASSGATFFMSIAPKITVDFTCEYNTDYETHVGSALVNPDSVDNSLTSTGNFVFQLNTLDPVYTSRSGAISSWSSHDAVADPYNVGSTLYYKVCQAMPLDNIYFSVPDCTVTNANKTESYGIMVNHQTDEFVKFQRVGRDFNGTFSEWNSAADNVPMPAGSWYSPSNELSNDCLYFSYTVFEFVGDDNDGDLRLTCDVHACNYDEAQPNDVSSCVSEDLLARRKRSTESIQQYWRVAVDIPLRHLDV